MKKILNVSIAVLLLTSMGCKRTIDFLEHHPAADLDLCQIYQFGFKDIDAGRK